MIWIKCVNFVGCASMRTLTGKATRNQVKSNKKPPRFLSLLNLSDVKRPSEDKPSELKRKQTREHVFHNLVPKSYNYMKKINHISKATTVKPS